MFKTIHEKTVELDQRQVLDDMYRDWLNHQRPQDQEGQLFTPTQVEILDTCQAAFVRWAGSMAGEDHYQVAPLSDEQLKIYEAFKTLQNYYNNLNPFSDD